jgi:hypothetical protein
MNTNTLSELHLLMAENRIFIQADETRFRLLSEGPSVLAMKSLNERVARIEEGNRQVDR